VRRCLSCGASHTVSGWRCPRCGWEPPRQQGFPLFAPELANAGEGVSYQREALERAEDIHFWFRSRRKLLRWCFDIHLPDARRFLEIGCGSGAILAALAKDRTGLSLTASELLIDRLPAVRNRLPNAELVQMDAQRIPFRAHFDGAGAFDVLEHIPDDGAALEEIHAVLQPGGLLLLTVPQHPWLWSSVDEYSGHQRRYTAAELRAKLRAARFEIVWMTSFVTLLLPALLASRRAARVRETLDPVSELRLPRSVDFAFDKVMALERTLIRWGICLPVGGSLLVVSRRR